MTKRGAKYLGDEHGRIRIDGKPLARGEIVWGSEAVVEALLERSDCTETDEETEARLAAERAAAEAEEPKE